MGRLTTAAVYNLEVDEAGVINDRQTGEPFDVDSYTRMKYGDKTASLEFAKDLAETIADASPALIEDGQPPEFLAAYKAIPHAAYYVANYTLGFINNMRIEIGNEPGSIVKVHKSKTMTVNYASISAVARQAAYEEIEFEKQAAIRQDSQAVIIDDVRVTGTAERKFLGVFSEFSPSTIMLGYIAMFDPDQALSHPDTENKLNGTDNIQPENILEVIKAGQFDLNIRTLNMILSANPEKLISFLEQCPRSLVQQMFKGSVESGNEFVAHYQTGINCMQQVVEGL